MDKKYSLKFSDLLEKENFELIRTKLIRHSLNHKRFQLAYNSDSILEYTKMQIPNFYNDADLVLAFVGDQGTSARLIGCYKLHNIRKKIVEGLFSEKMPKELLEHPKNIYHELEETEYFSDLVNRLYIDWGSGTVNWHQSAKNDKPIIAIKSNPKLEFNGYEKIVLMYDQLKQIIKNQVTYENWHIALKSVSVFI